ncbi:hypothetical protein ABQJ54_18775 [Rhodanobacter sp. Si-c]|uniref:Uncharacterized protein n=1 Tax=Rhodanobacter lycopersici TaxID=3162487 RepID=A0ABV3QJ06_9GAMM
MSNNDLTNQAPAWLRLTLGVPLLCMLVGLFAWVEWAVQGFTPELSPRHWFDYGGMLLADMSFAGGIATLLIAGVLWILGIVAMELGERSLQALHRWRSR